MIIIKVLRSALPWLTAASVSLLSAHGQDARQVTFRVMCFKHVDDLTSASVPVKGGKEIGEVPLYTSGFSDEFEGSFDDGVARFFKEGTYPAASGAEPEVIAEGKLTSDDRQAFLLLPSSDGKIPYRVHAMSDDVDAFPMGSTRVLNLAALPIRLNLAGSNLPPIKPGGSVIYPQVKSVDEWNMYTARIEFSNGKEGWIPVASQSWKASDRKRDIVVMALDSKTKRPSIKLYQDIPPRRQTELTGGDEVQP